MVLNLVQIENVHNVLGGVLCQLKGNEGAHVAAALEQRLVLTVSAQTVEGVERLMPNNKHSRRKRREM